MGQPANPTNKLLFFFNDTATTEIYPLSLHDALPISPACRRAIASCRWCLFSFGLRPRTTPRAMTPEGPTPELQPLAYLACRLLLEKTSWASLSGSSRH